MPWRAEHVWQFVGWFGVLAGFAVVWWWRGWPIDWLMPSFMVVVMVVGLTSIIRRELRGVQEDWEAKRRESELAKGGE